MAYPTTLLSYIYNPVIAKSLLDDFGFSSIKVGTLNLSKFIIPNLLGSCTRYANIVASAFFLDEEIS